MCQRRELELSRFSTQYSTATLYGFALRRCRLLTVPIVTADKDQFNTTESIQVRPLKAIIRGHQLSAKKTSDDTNEQSKTHERQRQLETVSYLTFLQQTTTTRDVTTINWIVDYGITVYLQTRLPHIHS